MRNRCMQTLKVEHPIHPPSSRCSGAAHEYVRCEKELRHSGRHKGHTAAGVEKRWNDAESNTIEYDKEWS